MTRTIRLGTNRGKPRLWLEGQILTDNGFNRYEPIVVNITAKSIIIEAGITTDRAKQRHVSGKEKNGQQHPIIDINGKDLAPFADRDLRLIASHGYIVIRPTK